MLQPISQAEQAHRDTLIAKASGFALDRLGDLYGIPRIPRIAGVYWRDALAAAALGPRDRLGTVFSVLRAMLAPWESVLTTTSDLQLAQPDRLVGGTPAGVAWNCAHTHRLVEVEGHGIFWSTGVSGADLLLATTATTYWRAASWAANESGVLVKVIPFWLREEGARLTVYLDAELFGVPPTYLLPEAVAARPAGQPIGGALVQDATVQATLDGPLYLPGDGLGGLIQSVIDGLCAAGVQVQLVGRQWCATALGMGTLKDLADYGRPIAGGGPPAILPILGFGGLP
jgi:hypothetical protein